LSDILYLHGFASGPASKKGSFFARQFAQIGVTVHQPDLNEGDFTGLTITRQAKLAARLLREIRPGLVMGSSMGGYLAALCAALEPELTPALVLLAPAFGLAHRWSERLGPEAMEEWKNKGTMDVYHYGDGRMRAIGYGLYEDALWHPEHPDVKQPTLIFHGRRDDVVSPEQSVRFAWGRPNVQLELLDSDHALTDVLDTIWTETVAWRSRLPANLGKLS
jgi:pimeloyl-ACP methyl ester carboxylesterase